MASNVFPMLSSSPPPIDDCPDDDDDDDEFGNFTSANIPFDSSFDSPVAVDKFKSFKSGDNGLNNADFTDEINKFASFDNSATSSPQESGPDFSENCKNSFKAIKSEHCESPQSVNDLKISSSDDLTCPSEKTSLKPVSHKTENFVHSQVDTEHFTPEDCDINSKSSKNSNGDNVEEKTSENHSSDPNSSDIESLPPCNLPKDKTIKQSSHEKICDEPENCISDPIPDLKLSLNDTEDKCKFSLENSVLDSNFDDNESIEEFGDFHHSEIVFPEDDIPPSSLNFVCNSPATLDKDKSDQGGCETGSNDDQVDENPQNISENEFDDFQSSSGVEFAQPESSKLSKDDFEYDDFQDFQYSDVPKEVDDFANFQDFADAAAASNEDDFADFSAAPFDSSKVPEPSEQDDFAEFEEADFSMPTESISQTSSVPQKSTDTLSTVINAIFPICDNLQDCDTSEEISPQILEQTCKSRRLWEKLHEVEQAPSLRFQWSVSHSFQQLLRSVNVDYHSILRTSSVPIFASGLSLLEPVKGLSNSVNHESEDRNHTPKDPIPPVEFDWNSSGLINPLDSEKAASTLMDLSFLSSVETDTNGTINDHSFENELLKPSPAFLCTESSSKTPILEQLLSKNLSSLPNSKLSHRPSDLSSEAVRVLDQLPDLSFMQAKVLMFPISSKT